MQCIEIDDPHNPGRFVKVDVALLPVHGTIAEKVAQAKALVTATGPSPFGGLCGGLYSRLTPAGVEALWARP